MGEVRWSRKKEGRKYQLGAISRVQERKGPQWGCNGGWVGAGGEEWRRKRQLQRNMPDWLQVMGL